MNLTLRIAGADNNDIVLDMFQTDIPPGMVRAILKEALNMVPGDDEEELTKKITVPQTYPNPYTTSPWIQTYGTSTGSGLTLHQGEAGESV